MNSKFYDALVRSIDFKYYGLMLKENVIALCLFAPAVLGSVAPYLEPIPSNFRKIAVFVILIFSLIGACLLLWPSKAKELLNSISPSGHGGNARVVGQNSRAEGGTGGEGGAIPGGNGGNAEAIGENSYARGGDGGNAPQPDGRGGRRTMSAGERLN